MQNLWKSIERTTFIELIQNSSKSIWILMCGLPFPIKLFWNVTVGKILHYIYIISQMPWNKHKVENLWVMSPMNIKKSALPPGYNYKKFIKPNSDLEKQINYSFQLFFNLQCPFLCILYTAHIISVPSSFNTTLKIWNVKLYIKACGPG